MSQKRPAAGGESCEQDFFHVHWKDKIPAGTHETKKGDQKHVQRRYIKPDQ